MANEPDKTAVRGHASGTRGRRISQLQYSNGREIGSRRHGTIIHGAPVSGSLLLASAFFQGVGPRGVRQEGGLIVPQGHPPPEPEAVRQAQGAEVPGAAYHRLLPRDGAEPRLHKRGVHGNSPPLTPTLD